MPRFGRSRSSEKTERDSPAPTRPWRAQESPKSDSEAVTVSFRIPPDTKKRIDELSDELGVSKLILMVSAVEALDSMSHDDRTDLLVQTNRRWLTQKAERQIQRAVGALKV